MYVVVCSSPHHCGSLRVPVQRAQVLKVELQVRMVSTVVESDSDSDA